MIMSSIQKCVLKFLYSIMSPAKNNIHHFIAPSDHANDSVSTIFYDFLWFVKNVSSKTK